MTQSYNTDSASSTSSSSSSSSSSDSSKSTQVFFLCFSGILVVVLFLSKYLEDAPRLRRFLSEPAMTLLVGIVCSFLVRILNETEYEEYQNHYDEESEQAGEDFDEDVYADQYMGDLPQFFLFFPNNIFFMALLPPILFNSGYQLQKELFYRHFSPIALYSCIGTCISAFGAGGFLILMKHFDLLGTFDPTPLELLTFGALIAATDTVSVVGVLQRKRVDPHLFSLVFGESALNDAVAIVLFKTLAEFLKENHDSINNNNNGNYYDGGQDDAGGGGAGGEEGDETTLGFKIGKYLLDLCVQAIVSPILGLLFAGFMSLAFKHGDLREHRLLELSLYILPVYIPFILAEVLELSGMITIFTTGIFARRYMEPNVSAPTGEYAGILFQLMSFLAETCIFLELGLSVFGLHKSYYFRFIALAFVAALLGRALSVYPLSFLYNFSLTRPIPVSSMVCNSTTCGTEDTTTNDFTTTSALSNYQLFSKDGIIMDAATVLREQALSQQQQQQQQQQNQQSSTTKMNQEDNGDKTTTKRNNADDDDDDDDDDDNNNAFGPIQLTFSRTSSYLQENLPRPLPRETPARKRDQVIPLKFMHILWFAGLRGAVAYACAREFPDVNGNKNVFIAATMCIVLVTIVIMGGLTESLMDLLQIRMNVDNDEYMKIWHKQRRLKGKFLHFEYNYIYRFVVRDNTVEFMDESCGYVDQVHDNSDVIFPGSGRRLRFLEGVNNNNIPSSSDSVRTMKRAGKSLMDDHTADAENRVRHIGGGDLEDEIEFIQAQLDNSNNPPPSNNRNRTLKHSLSNASSVGSGQYDWDVACRL